MILSIVALVEVLAIAIVSVSAWVETISTIKLDLNNGTIDNYVFTNANIGYGNGYDGKTIDLTKYFIPISSHIFVRQAMFTLPRQQAQTAQMFIFRP